MDLFGDALRDFVDIWYVIYSYVNNLTYCGIKFDTTQEHTTKQKL